MTLKWTILVLLEYQIIVTSPSITGVTYMDHFDFEERYRNVDECNPLHWHPLHLPAYCANIFEKLIRSRIASKTPVRLVREKEKHKNPDKKKHKTHSSAYHTQYEYPPGFYEFPFPIYQISSEYDEVYAQPYGEPLPPSPYEKMIELLKKDIMKGPSSPTVTVMPNIGPVALYNQAISKKSVNFIKKIAEAYVKATKKAYDDYYATYGNYYASEPHIYVYDSAKNNTKTEKKKPKKDKKEKAKKEKNDKDKIYRLKTKHGDVVTIIETKNAHLMKDDGPPLPPEWGNIQLPLPRVQ